MASPYDALLEPAAKAPEASPYDALLTPKASPYDALLTPPEQPKAPEPITDPVSHAASYKEGDPEYEVAFQADQARKNRSLGEKVGAVASTAATLSPWLEGAKGFLKFGGGLVTAPLHGIAQGTLTTSAPLLDAMGATDLAQKARNEAQSEGAESVLAGQQIEEGLKRSGRAISNLMPNVGDVEGMGSMESQSTLDAMTPEERKAHDTQLARQDFATRVQAAKNASQLAQGQPLDTGAVAAMSRAATGANPSEAFGPENLQAVGARPASPLVTESMSAAGDPQNLLLAAAPGLPGARTIAGGATELAGKALQVPMNVAENVAGRVGKFARMAVNPSALGAETAVAAALHPPSAAITGSLLGAKLAQKLGQVLESAGNEFRTGNPGQFTQAAEAAENAGKSSLVPNLQRALGNAVTQGAATAYGMAPINYATSGGDPEQFAQSEVGAGLFGAGMGALHASPQMRQMDQALQANLMAKHGETRFTDNPNYDNHDQQLSKFSQPDQDRINRLRSFLFGGTNTDVLVVDGPTFAKADGSDIGQDARGKISPDGHTIYLNSDAVQPGESAGTKTADTAGHEAGHAVVKYLADLTGEADSRGLMTSISGNLTPEQKSEMANNYWDALEKSTKGITPENRDAVRRQIEASNPPDKIIEENLAEITRSILNGQDVSKYALSKPLTEKITDAAQRMLKSFGFSPAIDPNATLAFKTRMVKEAARRMQDTLYDVGAQAREKRAAGQTNPELVRDLNKQLSALPKPDAQMPQSRVEELYDQRQALQQRIALAEKMMQTDLEKQVPASAPAGMPTATASPDSVTQDAMKMLQAMKIPRAQASAAIRVANEQHGTPIMDASHLATGAFRVTANGTVKPGEFTPKPEAPSEPVTAPINSTFNDELGQQHTVTGPQQGPARVGDIVATRDGQIRRITAIRGDTVDTARPIDPLNARGTLTHKLTDIQPLEHDYSETQPAQPAGTGLSVKPGPGGSFQVVDAAGNPVSNTTYATETAANQAASKTGQKSTFALPPSANGNDIIDAIQEQGGIHLGKMLKEERDHEFPHKGIWRNALTTSNPDMTPDEVARILETEGHGDGTPGTMFSEITKAIQARSNLRDQSAAEQRRQQRESKNVQSPTAPANQQFSPVTGTAGQEPLPVAETAPGTQRTPAELPTREAVDAIVADAEQKAVAAEKRGTESRASQERIYKAKVDALMNLIGDDRSGLHRETDSVGNTKIVGNFDLANPIHAALADLAGGVTKEAADNIENLQNEQGNTMHIRYRSAKSGTEESPWERVGMTVRKGEYVEDPAAERTEGTIQHKAIVPVQTVFKGGRPMEQVFTLDNILHNAESYNNFVRTKGLDLPLADERTMSRDAQVYAENHAHGWKGDGSGVMKGFPDSGLPKPDLNYTPDTIPADRFALMNLLMHSEDAGKYSERIQQVADKKAKFEAAKTDKQRTEAQGVLERTVQRMKQSEEAYSLGAENNPWVDDQTGETNQLRAKLKAAGFDTSDAFKSPFETLDPQHILESGDAPLPHQEGDIKTVRPTGFQEGAENVEPMSRLNAKAVAASFLPETSKATPFTPSAEDRNAIVSGEAPFLQRFAALMQKEDQGKLTPSEEDEIDALHQQVNREYPGGSKAFLKRYERPAFMPEENDTSGRTLWRSSDNPEVKSGAHLSENKQDAMAYQNNSGFGGGAVNKYKVDDSRTADVPDLGALSKILQPLLNEDQQKWADDNGGLKNALRDYGFTHVFHALENSFGPRGNRIDPVDLLSKDHDWIRFDDDFPEGSKTWRYIGDKTITPSFMPDESKPTSEPTSTGGETAPSGQPLNPHVSASQQDSGKPEDGNSPSERLTREAEEAGIQMSLETLKGLLRSDPAIMEKVRSRIAQATGKPARFQPETPSMIPGMATYQTPRINPRVAAQQRQKKRELETADR